MSITLSDLLAGALGGLLIFVLTVLNGALVNRRLRERERTGLLRILDTELERNIVTVTRFLQENSMRIPEKEGKLRWEQKWTGTSIETWEETRIRLAPLLSTEDFKRLHAFYYALNYVTETVRRATDGVSPLTTEEIGNAADVVRQLPELGKKARDIAQRHIGLNG
jgi:hypothetical protein